MAAAVALPHPRHRGGRRTRTGEGDYLSTGENSARPQPGVLAVSVIRADSRADSTADATYADAFIQAFSLTPGAANVRLQVPGQYNELQARPIVELPDGRYFLPIAFNLSESIYESPFYWMNRDALYIETAKRHRGEFAERKTAALLRSVFGNHRVFAKVKIKKGKKETVTDIDVLALAGNRR